MKLIRNKKVGASMTDSKAKLSLIGILQIEEDAIAELFGELRLDNITMKKQYGTVWVSTKNKIKMLKEIAWDEGFYTVSFISSMTRGTVHVDVAIKNMSEELCAYARVEYCMLDVQTGRLRKVSMVGIDGEAVVEKPETEIAFIRFNSTGLPENGRVQVKSTNIDFSGHTNNIEYIRFMLNTYSVQELETRPVKEIEVFYTNQSFENDVLVLCKGSFEGKDLFVLQKEDMEIVRSEIVF